MKTFETSQGQEVKVYAVMIDIDGTNLEEGVDVVVDGEFAGELVGITPEEFTEDMLDSIIEY